jgi:UDP-N-acetylglucosamine/UDP-N-acetylgalactosamine diphosphorylase
VSKEKILALLEKHGQRHILEHYQDLSPDEQKMLIQEMERLDLPLVFGLHEKYRSDEGGPGLPRKIEPAAIQSLPGTLEETREHDEARRVGESLIRENRVAVLIVAGGQGTRLGFAGPKGKFPISPVAKKSLFQVFAESLKAVCLKYHARIPLLIMTSRENHRETEDFFREHDSFGLPRDSVSFFSQQMLATAAPDGGLILQDRTHLLANPDGHGGSLKALYQSGLLRTLIDQGYSELFYCQVDNPLVKIADPCFIGFHCRAGSEISTKVVRRQNAEEKVGIYGAVNGRPAILEYSDFEPEEYRAVDDQGKIRYWAGNIAVHVISLSFIERLNRRGFALPYHRAVKEMEIRGPDGQPRKATVWKFETFVFDALPVARNTCCLEVNRSEEFSPVKNLNGIDSPDTAQEAMCALHRTWLRDAGVEIHPEAQVEISPLYALDKDELLKKIKGQQFRFMTNCYLGDSS